MILLSIVIPCFNEERFIQHCINSIVNQAEFQLGKIEIVVVNDGSTDRSGDIISLLACENENIRLIETSNNGLSISRNIGILHCTGEYIMFVDADDWVSSECFLDIADIALVHSPDVIIGLVEGIPTPGVNRSYTDPVVDFEKLNEDSEGFLVDMHISGIKVTPAWKYIFKRSVVVSKGLLFDNVLHEDQLWTPMLLCHAQTYKLYPKYFYKYRLGNDGLSSNCSLSAAYDCLVICGNLFSVARDFEDKKREFLYHRCAHILRKIDNFALSFTQEEGLLLEQLKRKFENVISYCKDY